MDMIALLDLDRGAIAFYKNQNRNRARFFIKLELER